MERVAPDVRHIFYEPTVPYQGATKGRMTRGFHVRVIVCCGSVFDLRAIDPTVCLFPIEDCIGSIAFPMCKLCAELKWQSLFDRELLIPNFWLGSFIRRSSSTPHPD